jgi:hypothetical protein
VSLRFVTVSLRFVTLSLSKRSRVERHQPLSLFHKRRDASALRQAQRDKNASST